MTFLADHVSKEDPLARVLFYSVFLHYALFFIFFGNPFLLNLDDAPEDYGMQKGFDIQLLPLPGVDGEPFPNQQALGLFPREVARASRGEPDGKGLNPEAFYDKPSQITQAPKASEMSALNNPRPPVHVAGRGKALRLGPAQFEGKASLSEEPPPRVTSRKPPPNMTGPEDCMIKVVGMVCPNGDAKCIAEYKAFCATLPR